MTPMDREFPTLGAGDQQESGQENREGQPPEAQYGPGPSLRPQSELLLLFQEFLIAIDKGKSPNGN